MRIFVKPANPDHRIPIAKGRYIPKEGMSIELTSFVQYLIDQKDVVVIEDKAEPAKASAAATAAPAPVAKEG